MRLSFHCSAGQQKRKGLKTNSGVAGRPVFLATEHVSQSPRASPEPLLGLPPKRRTYGSVLLRGTVKQRLRGAQVSVI
jgi:hypothetical protein